MAIIAKNGIECWFNSLNGAYAPNTVTAYYADVRRFVDWCDAQKYQPFPLTNELVLEYLQNLSIKLKYSTIRRHLVSIQKLNALIGHPRQTESETLKLELRRIRRAKAGRPKQAHGINLGLLTRAIDAQPNTLIGIRNKAVLSLGYDFLARRSELTALRVGDIEKQTDGTLRGIIRRSKTDQFGRGRLVFGSRRSATLLGNWMKIKPDDIEWLFCPISSGRCINRPLCGRSVSDIIKKSIVSLKGERPRDREISGHSLRVGAAQDLLTNGHDTVAIMRAGGWSSLNSVIGYLREAEHNIWS